MVVNLAFEAGRLAERRGWTSVDLVEPEGLNSVLPGAGEVIVLAPVGTFSLQHARDLAALSASGKSVAVVSPVALPEDVQAWLPEACCYVPRSAELPDVPSTTDRSGDSVRLRLVQQVLRGLAADPDPAIRRIVAEQSEAPKDLLRTLADDPDPSIRLSVARSQDAPVDLLHLLIGDSDSYVALAAALNPMAPIRPSQNRLRQVAEDCRRRVAEGTDDDDAWEALREIAENPRCPEDLLRILVADDVVYMKGPIGRNPSTPVDLLAEIVLGSDSETVEEFIRYEHMPPEVLRAVADRGDRWWATQSQNTPVDVLRALSHDSDSLIRTGVGKNPSTPVDALENLLGDPEMEVRYGVAVNPAVPPSLLERLAGDADPWVRKGVASNPDTAPQVLRRLAGDPDEGVREAVAANVNVPPDLLSQLAQLLVQRLARSGDLETQWSVARVVKNSNTPVDVLRMLSTAEGDSLRRAVAENSRTPVDVLRALSVDADTSLQIALGLSANPNTPVDVLQGLAGSADALVRQWVAGNAATPAGVLGDLAQAPEVEVRSAVAANPKSPVDVLSVLAADSEGRVRWAAAQNPATPLQVLESMANVAG